MIKDWLQRVGFTRGNPFALTEADKETDLPSYVVAHPALNTMLDEEHQPASSILHAPRGAGKSTMRRMFKEHYQKPDSVNRALVVSLIDWMPVVQQRNDPAFDSAIPHYEMIVTQLLQAIAIDDSPPAHAPDISLGYLYALYDRLRHTLTVDERYRLADRFPRLESLSAQAREYDLGHMPVIRRLQIIAQLVRSLGYRVCYILIDRIDELVDTVADWENGAMLLEPLIGNLLILEIPGLAFKYFIPSEIVSILEQRGRLRTDRISCASMVWKEEHLDELLQSRLAFYSAGSITHLAQIAAPGGRDADALLVNAAAGSPRTLLNLGNALLRACADEVDSSSWLIDAPHLIRVFGADSLTLLAQVAPASLLRIADGRLWFGERERPDWQDFPDLQRRLLEYLYRHRGQICRKEDIMSELWPINPPADDGSLRKLGDRLIEAIEPIVGRPRYIHKLRGGHFRLDNATD